MCRTFCKNSGSDPPFEETVSDTAGTNDPALCKGLTDPSSLKAFPRAVLISYGFFFGWAAVCFGRWSLWLVRWLRWALFKDNFRFPGNVCVCDLLSKLLQIEFDIGDSLFQGFVFVWYMFVSI